MARKSRYGRTLPDAAPEAGRCVAAVYLRLSVEDGDSAESNSIGNQRKICLSYLEGLDGLEAGKVYVDDGHTGMNYRRPGFQAMLADLEAKKAGCVIVKDVSRLGRHYIMTSEYVERIFPAMGVRLICINDGYDSADPSSDRESLLMPFKLMMNDTYVKDTARRIKSSIHAKMAAGKYLPASGSIPYGYLRDPRRNTFTPDPETAPVVRRIFELRAQGESFNSIARRLNAEGVPSPGRLRYDRGLTRSEKFCGALWLRGAVRKITGDPTYLGRRIHGRLGRDRLGGEKKSRPEEQWQVIGHAHEAILPEELFERVQRVNQRELERRAAFQRRDGPGEDYRRLFQGKVFCGSCGAKMTAGKAMSRESTPVSVYFNCSQYKYSNHQRCGNHYIRQEVLMNSLKRFLEGQIKAAAEIERLIAAVRKREAAPDGAQARLASLRGQRLHAEAKLERLLEDAAEGVLDREEYRQIKGRYLEERAHLERREREALAEYQRVRDALGAAEAWLGELRRCRELPAVDRGLLDALVDRILVYDGRDIRFSMAYRDPYRLLAACLGDDPGGAGHAG